jgi:hypothetical protein
MFVRVASFTGGDPGHIRDMDESERPELPAGVRRVMILDDAAGDRRLFLAVFDSREALEAARERFESMGDEMSEDVRGRRTSVEVYEVLFDEAVPV